MDFNDTPQEAQYRSQVRTWLDANAEGVKTTGATVFDANTRRGEANYVERAKEWQAKKTDAGYGVIQWPKEYGGAGGSTMQALIYREEEARYQVPAGVFDIGLGMCGPVLMMYADEKTKKRLLPSMARGTDIWCQLFSEPIAGSDLAGLRTRAQRDGDDWIVNGQKVWTSGAHYSKYGILVTRHDPTLAKHKGLTFFWLDMESPGVEVKPIKQISGSSNFNEVFFTNVRIPDSQRLGEVGEGWQVSLTTLMNERFAVGSVGPPDARELLALAQRLTLADGPAIKSAAVRSRIADWYVESEGLRLTKARTMTKLSRGETPGPEASIAKVVGGVKQQEIGSFGADLLEQAGVVLDGEALPGHGLFQQAFLASPGIRIAGGSDEILRNIIAERVLNLPGDIRVDRDVPYNEIPSGKV
jgi:alkylation response protein AidB-like acyl-CoA dehydrogenase